ncbi:major capsid protein [Desulfovibrio piger]|uniref:major capsid protein n=1 Tax=Desulfovibrio piger TaxID=901 RepID=UPI0026F361A5|nr:major capsid protein [Desulfovibrio piger]
MARRRRMRKRSLFSLSHYKLASLRMGELVPISCMEVLPGDTFQHSVSAFLRVAPLVTPVMHPVHVRIWHFFVPNRLIWNEWEAFRTRGEDGTSVPEFPTIVSPSGTGWDIGSLADYLGIPTGIPDLEVSALPFRAYTLIENEWFRNQDTTDPYPISLESGQDTTTNTALFPSPWGKDYFTTASETPQKGPEVTIPVNMGDAGTPTITGTVTGNGRPTFTSTAGSITKTDYLHIPSSGGSENYIGGNVSFPKQTGSNGSTNNNGLNWANPALKVELNYKPGEASIGTVNISDWREAMALQRFEEQRSLYGSRYTEFLKTLGIRASDARLQRPEYLGGGRQTIQFSEVLQTAEGTDPVGTLRGHGIGAMKTNRYRRFFEEDGLIMSFVSVRPIGVYMQGLPRMWSRRSMEDFWTPQFQHLSQQPVYTKELYAAVDDKEKIFGYQNIYDEYRSCPSSVSGEMRTILNSWHMARDFSAAPVLNTDFITAPPTNRVFAAQENDTLYAMFYHTVRARRLMARTGKPR